MRKGGIPWLFGHGRYCRCSCSYFEAWREGNVGLCTLKSEGRRGVGTWFMEPEGRGVGMWFMEYFEARRGGGCGNQSGSQSQTSRRGLNRDNHDNRRDCLEGVIANALVMRGTVCKCHYFEAWRDVGINQGNRKCHESTSLTNRSKSARRMRLNGDKRLNRQ